MSLRLFYATCEPCNKVRQRRRMALPTLYSSTRPSTLLPLLCTVFSSMATLVAAATAMFVVVASVSVSVLLAEAAIANTSRTFPGETNYYAGAEFRLCCMYWGGSSDRGYTEMTHAGAQAAKTALEQKYSGLGQFPKVTFSHYFMYRAADNVGNEPAMRRALDAMLANDCHYLFVSFYDYAPVAWLKQVALDNPNMLVVLGSVGGYEEGLPFNFITAEPLCDREWYLAGIVAGGMSRGTCIGLIVPHEDVTMYYPHAFAKGIARGWTVNQVGGAGGVELHSMIVDHWRIAERDRTATEMLMKSRADGGAGCSIVTSYTNNDVASSTVQSMMGSNPPVYSIGWEYNRYAQYDNSVLTSVIRTFDDEIFSTLEHWLYHLTQGQVQTFSCEMSALADTVSAHVKALHGTAASNYSAARDVWGDDIYDQNGVRRVVGPITNAATLLSLDFLTSLSNRSGPIMSQQDCVGGTAITKAINMAVRNDKFSAECTICPANTFSLAAADVCTPCAADKVSSPGATECDKKFWTPSLIAAVTLAVLGGCAILFVASAFLIYCCIGRYRAGREGVKKYDAAAELAEMGGRPRTSPSDAFGGGGTSGSGGAAMMTGSASVSDPIVTVEGDSGTNPPHYRNGLVGGGGSAAVAVAVALQSPSEPLMLGGGDGRGGAARNGNGRSGLDAPNPLAMFLPQSHNNHSHSGGNNASCSAINSNPRRTSDGSAIVSMRGAGVVACADEGSPPSPTASAAVMIASVVLDRPGMVSERGERSASHHSSSIASLHGGGGGSGLGGRSMTMTRGPLDLPAMTSPHHGIAHPSQLTGPNPPVTSYSIPASPTHLAALGGPSRMGTSRSASSSSATALQSQRPNAAAAAYQHLLSGDDQFLASSAAEAEKSARVALIESDSFYVGAQLTSAIGAQLSKVVLANGTTIAMRESYGANEAESREHDLITRLPPHPGIIDYYAVKYVAATGATRVFMEYVSAQSLKDIVAEVDRPMGDMIGKAFAKQILTAIAFLHHHNVAHRNLVNDHILVDARGRVKLGDLMTAKEVARGNDESLTIVAAPHNQPPEVLTCKNLLSDEFEQATKGDVWCFGLCCVEIQNRNRGPWPLEAVNTAGILKFLQSDEPIVIPSHISPTAADFMLRCLDRNPANRWSAEQLLAHPWMIEESITSNSKSNGNGAAGPQQGGGGGVVGQTLRQSAQRRFTIDHVIGSGAFGTVYVAFLNNCNPAASNGGGGHASNSSDSAGVTQSTANLLGGGPASSISTPRLHLFGGGGGGIAGPSGSGSGGNGPNGSHPSAIPSATSPVVKNSGTPNIGTTTAGCGEGCGGNSTTTTNNNTNNNTSTITNNNCAIAVKSISYNVKDAGETTKLRKAMKEIAIMQTLDHPNIVKYLFLEQTEVGPSGHQTIYIAMEYVAGGTLKQHILAAANRRATSANSAAASHRKTPEGRVGGGGVRDSLANSTASRGGPPPLVKTLDGLSEAEAAHFTREILLGLAYLHDKGFTHRDIKPSNCLLTAAPGAEGGGGGGGGGDSNNQTMQSEAPKRFADNHLKLADFGTAFKISGTETVSLNMQGTLLYMAPEIIREERPTSSADVWSLGASTMEMLTGHAPWSHLITGSSFGLISLIAGQERLTLPSGLSPDCSDFLGLCLDRDPAKRPSAEQLLKHPWLAQRE